MNIKHEVIDLFGQSLDLLTDETAGIRIAVSRLGAELISLARRNAQGEWIGFLYRDGDISKAKEGWNNHATVMGFFAHRLVNGESQYRGERIIGGTHGFIRHKQFAAPEIAISEDKGALTYYIGSKLYGRDEYPLDVTLALTYELAGDTLRVTFCFTNHEPERDAHLSFGWHPGFAATTPDSWRLTMPKGRYIRHLAPGNFLSGETEIIDFAGGAMPFANRDLPDSFLLEISEIEQPFFVFADQPSGREIVLNYSGAPYLTLWSDGHAFLCVEPCWGLPDSEPQRAFEDKVGIQKIAANGALSRTITVNPYFKDRH